MRNDAPDQQRQKHIAVVCQLKRKHDARKGRAHRSTEYRAHADQRPKASALVRQKHRLQTAERAAHHQQGSQNAARSAGTK